MHAAPAPIRYADRVDAGGGGAAQHAPAAERNAGAIADVLGSVLAAVPATRRPLLLELASGTGQHAAHLAARFPQLTQQPSDVDPAARASIAARTAHLDAVRPPLALDVAAPSAACAALPRGVFDVALAVNLLHISEPACVPGLMAVARHALAPGGTLLLYGPFLVDGAPTTESNAAFDAKLRGMDPAYGLRDVAAVAAAASAAGLVHARTLDMPANNFMMLFTAPGDAGAGA